MFRRIFKYVGSNFAKPNGIGGEISTKIMNIMNQKQYKTVLENINLESNDNVLDIGFGNGYLLDKLYKQHIPIRLYGIDISEDMLKKVSEKNRKIIENGDLKLFLENINKTSFNQNYFDKIYTINTIYFWEDLIKCFSEIKRILKPNGIFINVIYSKYFLEKMTIFTKYGYNKYAIEDIVKITEDNGMKTIGTIEIVKNKSYCIISKNTK